MNHNQFGVQTKKDANIVVAARNGCLELVSQLITGGVHPDFQESMGGPTALMTAAQRGDSEMLARLLDAGADVNKQDREHRTALIIAAMNKKVECVKVLMYRGADPNLYSKNGWTPLYVSAKRGYLDIAQALVPYLHLHINMEIQNTVGGNALMEACTQGHLEIADFLIDHGANLNARDKNNWTALMKAADKGQRHVVTLLVQRNADVTVADNSGFTVLHLAAKTGMTEVVEALTISRDLYAILNQQDLTLRTALFYAAQDGHLETVKLLMKHGADPSIPDKAQQTALTAAEDPTGQILEALSVAVSGEKSIESTDRNIHLDNMPNSSFGLFISAKRQRDEDPITLDVPSSVTDDPSSTVNNRGKASFDEIQTKEVDERLKIVQEVNRTKMFLALDADYSAARWCGDVEAIERLQVGAQQNETFAEAYLALLYLHGCIAFCVDRAKAKRLATSFLRNLQTCLYYEDSPGQRFVYFLHGEFLLLGICKDCCEESAVEKWHAAALQGNANAQCALGHYCLQMGNPVEAVAWFQQAAEQMHLESLYQLGCCYDSGHGVGNSSTTAGLYFQQAAAAGHACALCRYGQCLQEGHGVVEDKAKALEFYQKSADRGYHVAHIKLALFHHSNSKLGDVNAEEELAKAAVRYRIAANHGLGAALLPLALILFNSVPRTDVNDREAAAYFKRAADQGESDAMYMMGVCLELGRGVSHDMSGALAFYRQAVISDHAHARINLAFCLVCAVRTTEARIEASDLLESIYSSLRRNAQFANFPTLCVLLPRQQNRIVLTQIDQRYHLRFLNEVTFSASTALGYDIAVGDQWIHDASPILKAGLVHLLLRSEAPLPTNIEMAIHIVRSALLNGDDPNQVVRVELGSTDGFLVAYTAVQETLREARRDQPRIVLTRAQLLTLSELFRPSVEQLSHPPTSPRHGRRHPSDRH